MAAERTDILRDLADIARVANGPGTPYVHPRLPQAQTDLEVLADRNRAEFSDPPRRFSIDGNPQFSSRDQNAVQYTKSQLIVGDTLVVVRYPNNLPVYDATGFQLCDRHRVNSDRLKAASPLFKQLLEDDWQQHRFKRRNKLIGNLPEGINYVLDLTPPEEGDEALELTADLSCSLGLRRWYKSEFTECKVAHGMVGGRDETTNPPNFDLPSPSPPKTPDPEPAARLYQETRFPIDHEAALQEALDASKRMHDNLSSQKSNSQDEDDNGNETLDYCPIRHRTGIERLLQIIEGKDPRLDSAPKVWTLAVLANYFKCADVVVDYIVTWMVAEPNCKIFDVLPEDALRIGFLMKNQAITRYAFTILVSEEALRVGTARQDQPDIAMPNSNTKQTTRLGRPKESLDEDLLNSIQHAGRNFHARIEHEVQVLLDPKMIWLQTLPEFAKILQLRNFIEAKANFAGPVLEDNRSIINVVINDLMNYTRGRILWVFFHPLDESQRKSWNEHRWQEQHIIKGENSEYIFNELTDQERLMTRFFWGTMRLLKWNVCHAQCDTNLIHDRDDSIHSLPLASRVMDAAKRHNIPKVWIYSLRHATERLNALIVKSIKDDGFNNGIFPGEALKVEPHRFRDYENPFVEHELDSEDEEYIINAWNAPDKPDLWKAGLRAQKEVTSSPDPAIKTSPSIPSTTTVFSPSLPSSGEGLTNRYHSALRQFLNADPHIPIDSDISFSSPFFSLSNLLNQIDAHIQKLCNHMLSRGENERLSICDTLLCLSDEEYKYLPLWANGLDDGSGGVFEMDVPPAERGGPVGPGPSYHTGSTLNSRASTEIGFDDNSSVFGSSMDRENVHTSIGVEDNYSEDHVDRRRTILERDMLTPLPSESSFDLMEDEVMGGISTMDLPIRDKGKGKEIAVDANSEDTFSVIHHPLDSASAEEITQQIAMMGSFSSLSSLEKSSPPTAATKAKDLSPKFTEDDFEPVGDTYDADTFFNTADDADADFDFGIEDDSDDDGNKTETEMEQ